METKNIYAIKISGINSDWTNYRVWKNDQDIEPDDLTIEDWNFLKKELYDFYVIFKDHIEYLERL